MKALTVTPSVPNSATLLEIPEPVVGPGQLLVELICLGVCGTDREILRGDYGTAPADSPYLIVGHESLGRVVQVAPSASADFQIGDLVVGIVRHPDPVPCANCAVGEWDMCRNGLYTEHGINQRHGFACERYCLDAEHAVKVDPNLGELGVLLEPATILAKAWEHIERIGNRAHFAPAKVLVMGAGPVGLLAAMMGRQRGLAVEVLDQAQTGIKPHLVQALGANYLTDLSEQSAPSNSYDVVLECTGDATLVLEAMRLIGPGGVTCLTGVSSGGRMIQLDAGSLNREIVLENGAIFGSVNANRRHYQQAAVALAAADRQWLGQLITGRNTLADWSKAFDRQDGTVKNIITGPAYSEH